MKELDCLGDQCPLPLMKLQRQQPVLDAGGSVRIVTDHSCSCESVRRYCEARGYLTRIEEPVNGIWEITVSRS